MHEQMKGGRKWSRGELKKYFKFLSHKGIIYIALKNNIFLFYTKQVDMLSNFNKICAYLLIF